MWFTYPLLPDRNRLSSRVLAADNTSGLTFSTALKYDAPLMRAICPFTRSAEVKRPAARPSDACSIVIVRSDERPAII